MSIGNIDYKKFTEFYENLHEYAKLEALARAITCPDKVKVVQEHKEFLFLCKPEIFRHWSMKRLFFKRKYSNIFYKFYLVVVDFTCSENFDTFKNHFGTKINTVLMFCELVYQDGTEKYASLAEVFKMLSKPNKLNHLYRSLRRASYDREKECFKKV